MNSSIPSNSETNQEGIDDLNTLPTQQEDLEDGPDKVDDLIYKSRLKKFIRQICEKEGQNIQFSKESEESLQQYYKFITAVLSYEIIDILQKNRRVQLNKDIIHDAVSNALGKSDVLSTAILELQNTIDNLYISSSESAINKATDYINFELQLGQNTEE
ncbi:hypothetical protein COM77_23290 [Bacillus cereus]|uniref:hypothetical protein n=1 Tax=Bacillus cereus TaxID=1396 RepID=UPI000BEB5D53|nr:hypothetical protein [Bacillus cereus]MDA1935457.1 hypothetical protein [Bacillus cereus]MDA1941362.1 hypothetical protein [Bacillus cereus]PEB33848.1 hypothetical protein COM77_23290 [Bacillus cereus]TKH24130.1 hypothetical protein FC692_21960 [Bacillus cereus]